MSKRKADKAGPIESLEQFLSPADHVAITLADCEASVAKAHLERDTARLQAFRLQTQLQIEQAEQKLREAKDVLAAAGKARSELAADLAKRYAISWEAIALEPISGQLLALPKD